MTGSIFGQECLLSGAFDEVKNVHSTHTYICIHDPDSHPPARPNCEESRSSILEDNALRAVRFLVGRGLLMYCQLAQRRREGGMKGTNALAREMISLGVGKIVIYKMMLAYRYVNGEAEQIEYARKIQSWFRGVRGGRLSRLYLGPG